MENLFFSGLNALGFLWGYCGGGAGIKDGRGNNGQSLGLRSQSSQERQITITQNGELK